MKFDIPQDVKFRADRYLIRGQIIPEGQRLLIRFGFGPGFETLKNDIKCMEGARWLGFNDPPRKVWSIANSKRNQFQLAYLVGEDPYQPYNTPLIDYESKRAAYDHQNAMTSLGITRRHCIWAAEMGVGKTLSAIEVMEQSDFNNWLWVGPRSALIAVRSEFIKWNAKKWPVFVTYEGLVKMINTWPINQSAPKGVIFDECSKIKNPQAQRSKAARHLADSMREEYGRDCYIVLMSGTPAPKNPADWWHLCEVACPGFLREGDHNKFKNRLGLFVQKPHGDGGSYPHLVAWRDDESKCRICGKIPDSEEHDEMNITLGEEWAHKFESGINEVSLLYRRMHGLVGVWRKKDCLNLPEKIYRQIICKPTPEILRAAKLIEARSDSAIKTLTLLRELSDGFQYREVENGTETCPVCYGLKVQQEQYDKDDPENPVDTTSLERGHRVIYNEYGVQIGQKEEKLRLGFRDVSCKKCKALGVVPHYERRTIQVDCPKDQAVRDLLDLYEEEGRVVFWAGFTGSIDRLVQLCIGEGWKVIRVDGRGWQSSLPGSSDELYEIFSKGIVPKVAFVGHPEAGGLGLNLTASSMECYYSNTFKAEDRIQSEDRIHRAGADANRGVTIWDIFHLPTDKYVFDNLQRKRDLQALSMGVLKAELSELKIEESSDE